MLRCSYRAVVTGKMPQDAGTFDAPLLGKESVTLYQVVECKFQPHIDKWVTVVDLEPKSGRHHQLRKHLAMAGHPIVGDPIYSKLPGIGREAIFEGWLQHGLYLWALELKFSHPVSSEDLAFSICEPDKFRQNVGRKIKPRKEATP
jgi:23S rRNA pseudouridine1911/1915/1917 synthase